MNDLQQFQIKQSCRLALPNGLQELMSDISREVLRSQPQDLCKFITEYLGALLEARDKLTIAAEICNEICHGSCQPELADELRDLGLSEEQIKLVDHVVQKYFEEGQGEKVHETTLLIKLSKLIDVNETMLQGISDAVRAAFQSHFIKNAVKYETYSSEEEEEEEERATKAAKNTVKFHENEIFKTWDHETEELRDYECENRDMGENREKEQSLVSASSMSLAGSYIELPKHHPYDANQCSHDQSTSNESPESEQMSHDYTEETKQQEAENKEIVDEIKKRLITVSSVSLAGSYLSLPRYKPYIATQCCRNLSTLEETPEKEQMNHDYTEETSSKKNNFSENKQSQSEIETDATEPKTSPQLA